MSIAPQFHWEPQPAAQALVDELITGFLARLPQAAALAARMKHDTGTRFKDWVDSIQVPRVAPDSSPVNGTTALESGATKTLLARLHEVGFECRPQPGAPDCYECDKGLFPPVILGDGPQTVVGIKVESVVDFLCAWRLMDDPAGDGVEGGPWSPLRRARAFRNGTDEMWVVERHGDRGFDPQDPSPTRVVQILKHSEAFRRRARDWEEDDRGLTHTEHLIDAAVADLGVDLSCDLFFAAEREFWQRKNRAAQVQKARQDKLGLGWANHDHHTYRTSRHCFAREIALLEKLGFHCRERFYAGMEAGWGAQVLEQPTAGIVIFADVDLSPEEVAGDFSHQPLAPRKELGTVGLWCALHGDSMLQAGMHHLECQFDHMALVEQFTQMSIKTMDPFTNFPFLRQAFTEGERWPVQEKRIKPLLDAGLITAQQAQNFRSPAGVIGSHLENLERNDGYKGFNQRGVSEIIAKTDPRKQAAVPAGA